MPRVERSRELARRRNRKKKLRKLREQYGKAGDRATKEAIEEKARKISPFVDLSAKTEAS